jgi:hypothetical protein
VRRQRALVSTDRPPPATDAQGRWKPACRRRVFINIADVCQRPLQADALLSVERERNTDSTRRKAISASLLEGRPSWLFDTFDPRTQGVTRRSLLGAGVASGAPVFAGSLGSLLSTHAAAALAGDAIWIEKSIPQLQGLMNSGALSSIELTQGYIKRISDLNPLLRAVIEVNPNAHRRTAGQ